MRRSEPRRGGPRPPQGGKFDTSAVEKAYRRFLAWTGRLDALVCAAGRLQAIGPLETVDPDAWWLDFETAVRGAQRTIRLTLPGLRESPSASISLLVGPGYNG